MCLSFALRIHDLPGLSAFNIETHLTHKGVDSARDGLLRQNENDKLAVNIIRSNQEVWIESCLPFSSEDEDYP